MNNIPTEERLRALEAENADLRRRLAALAAQDAQPSPPDTLPVPYADVYDAMPVPVVLYRPDGTAVAINRANEALVATPREAIVDHHNIFADPEAVAKGYVAHFRAAIAGAISRMPPTPYNTAEALLTGRTDDKTFWSESTYFPVYGPDGGLLIVGEVNMDVTERVHAEAAERRLNAELAERERRFRALFEHAGLAIALVRPDGTTIEVNQAMGALLGVPRELLAGRRILTRTHPDDLEPDRTLFAELGAGRRDAYTLEKRYVREDGSIIYGRLTNSVVRDAGGGVEFIIRMVEDVTAQRHAEAALRENQALLAAMIDQLPALVHLKGIDGRYILVNRGLAAVSGLTPDELIGRTDEELYPPEVAAAYRAFDAEVLRAGRTVERESTHLIDGELRHFTTVKFPLFDEAGHAYAVCGIALDISERRRAEEERLIFERRIRETQKLESLGLMAGGVAHDFNNLLVAILGNASVALEDLPADSPARHSLGQVELAARRAADLTRQLLAYAGKGHISTQPLDLNALIEEMAQLLHTSLPRSVALRYDFARGLPAIEADVTQLRQVVMNLVINAGEAVGAGPGLVTISTAKIHADRAYLSGIYLAPELEEGDYVVLAVSDTGEGMDAATRERIFEPFYSTKFTGRGLGLAAVLGIVRGHRGAIKVYSEPGRGSTFRVLLPAAGGPAVEPVVAPLQATARYEGAALVVDDEGDVRAVAELMLQRIGFRVILAADGDEGLRLFHAHVDDIVLALVDVTMPGMSGQELAAAILAHRPQARVVLMSGYSEHEAGDLAGGGLQGFLPKPFTVAELGAIVRRALDAP